MLTKGDSPMKRNRIIVLRAAVLAALALSGTASAQDLPVRNWPAPYGA